tara:strand:+ start:170 stop:412 length:243 start_codon:yes stop_codon:yes gene_type:complete
MFGEKVIGSTMVEKEDTFGEKVIGLKIGQAKYGLKVIGRKCLEAKGGFLDIGNDFFVLYLSAVTSDLKSCFDFNEFLSSL